MQPPKVREAIKMLKDDGFELSRRKGARRIYRKGSKVVTIHGADNARLKIGTWKEIIEQAGW